MPLGPFDLKYLETLKEKLIGGCKVCGGCGYNPQGESCECMKKLEEEIQIASAGIPEKYRQATLENYKGKKQIAYQKIKTYVEHLETARNKGIGLLLKGGEGAGKTYVGISILREAMRMQYPVYYTTLPQLLEDIKQSWGNVEAQKINEEKYMWSDFLFVDSLSLVYRATGNTSEWVDSTFSNLITHRDHHNRVTILSVKENIEEEKKSYCGNIYSILKPRMLEVNLLESGYRKNVEEKMMEDLMGGGDE